MRGAVPLSKVRLVLYKFSDIKEKYFIPLCSLVFVLLSCYATMQCDVCIAVCTVSIQFCVCINARILLLSVEQIVYSSF
jgi:hypothetical protein